jgi:hypothetical protein
MGGRNSCTILEENGAGIRRKKIWEENFMGTFWKKTEVVEPAFSNRQF